MTGGGTGGFGVGVSGVHTWLVVTNQGWQNLLKACVVKPWSNHNFKNDKPKPRAKSHCLKLNRILNRF